MRFLGLIGRKGSRRHQGRLRGAKELRLSSENVFDDPEAAFQKNVEPGRLSFSYEPFSRLDSHIGHGLRQVSAFGFAKTGKDFGLSQLVSSEHANILPSRDAARICEVWRGLTVG